MVDGNENVTWQRTTAWCWRRGPRHEQEKEEQTRGILRLPAKFHVSMLAVKKLFAVGEDKRTRGQEEERVLQRLPSLKTGPSLSPEIPWCCWTRPNTGIGHPCSRNRKQKALSEATKGKTKGKHRASKFLFFSCVVIDLLWVGNEIVSLPVCFLSPAKNFSITWLNIVISFSCFVL